jgi:iron complex outermembrane recepter protein
MKRNRYARLNEKIREVTPRTGATLPRCSSSMLALAVSAALCATPQSYAQQASGSLSLEEIVVTATKRKVNLQDVGQSITVLSTADIEKAGYKEMGDYIKDLPSVTLAQQQPARNDIVFRGVSTGVEEFYSDAQAGVYLDEQPITTNATQVSPYLVDIDRVESLPGPQGTLFGSSAETGVLRIITNKPDPSGFSGQYAVTGFATKDGAGSYEADGHLNIPLIDDKLTARIVAFYADNAGWIDNVYGTDLAKESNNANVVKSNTNDWTVSGARLAALWKVNDGADVLFNLTTQNDTTHGDWSNDPSLGDAKITRFIIDSRHDDWWQAAATVTADVGFAEFKSATAYFARHMTYTEDNMTYEQYKAKHYGSYYTTPTSNGVPGYNVYDTRLLSNNGFTKSTIFNDQHQYRVSQEFRLTSKGTSRLQWLGGLFYERVHDYWYYGTETSNNQLTGTYAWAAANAIACDPANVALGVQCPLAPTNTVYAQWFDRTVTQTAVFGEVSYKLTEPWTVTVGGRWFNYKRDISQRYDQPLGLPVDIGIPGSNSSSGNDSATLYKFGTQYKYNPDGMVYLLFSQGYRLGGENTARAAASGAVPLKYNPDKLDNYETGIKSQWWDKRLTLNASLFYMKWSQIQLESSTGPFWRHGTLNGGSADNLGIELSGALRATKQITLDFNVISADPKLTEQVVYPNGRTIPTGTQMVGAPKFKASAGLQYDFPWEPMGDKLWGRFDYSYQSLVYQDLLYASEAFQNAPPQNQGLIPNSGRVEPWSFGKLQLGLTLPSKLDVTLTLDNVWNSKGANWVTTSEGYYAEAFGDPRFHNMPAQFRPQNIGLTFRKNF